MDFHFSRRSLINLGVRFASCWLERLDRTFQKSSGRLNDRALRNGLIPQKGLLHVYIAESCHMFLIGKDLNLASRALKRLSKSVWVTTNIQSVNSRAKTAETIVQVIQPRSACSDQYTKFTGFEHETYTCHRLSDFGRCEPIYRHASGYISSGHP